MAKKKTTMYLDEDLLRSTRIMAARKGTSDSEIMETALREFLGMETMDRVWGRTDLSAEDALKLAVEEVHKYRAGE